MQQESKIDFYLHIGFHKTGSTWLQTEFFPYLNGIEYLGINAKTNSPFWIKWLRDAELYEQTPSFDFALIKHKRTKFLYSDERLSGHMLTGAGASVVPIKISRMPVNPYVIIVIRNQPDMYESVYRQYIWGGGTLSIDKFFELDYKCTESLNLNKLNYFNLIEFYRNNFGSENVLVLAYEQLLHNPNEFLKSIKNFINYIGPFRREFSTKKKRNASLGYYSHSILRILNIFLKKDELSSQSFSLKAVKKLLRILQFDSHFSNNKRFLSADMRSIIFKRYEQNNLKIEKEFPKIPLRQYGYFEKNFDGEFKK